MYTSVDKILYVFSVSDLSSPIATYDLPWSYKKLIISDNRLFLGASNTCDITVIEINTSLSKPLIELVEIQTSEMIMKMMKVGQELFLGEYDGYL